MEPYTQPVDVTTLDALYAPKPLPPEMAPGRAPTRGAAYFAKRKATARARRKAGERARRGQR